MTPAPVTGCLVTGARSGDDNAALLPARLKEWDMTQSCPAGRWLKPRIDGADVLVSNFRPGVIERLGFLTPCGTLGSFSWD